MLCNVDNVGSKKELNHHALWPNRGRQKSTYWRVAFVFACLSFYVHAFALDASDFSDLEGWTIAAVTNVNGEFEGCDFDRKIKFANGWVLTCSSYSYSYSYQPGAVIFAKNLNHKGRAFHAVKVLIDDEFYDMELIPAK